MPRRGKTPPPLFEPCAGGGVNLRPPKWADFEAWAALRAENRDRLTPWEPRWKDAQLSRSGFRARLAAYKKLTEQDSAYPFHVFSADDGKFVGACNLMSVQRGVRQSAHIGYWVGEAYQRRGFARASVRAAVRFAFQDLSLHRIEAAVQSENQASVKLLETCGFTCEGTARGYLKINGRWLDHLLFARLNTD